MKLLPYVDKEFADYKDKSVQEFRFVISEVIREQIFFARFVQNIEPQIKSISLIKAIKQAFRKHGFLCFLFILSSLFSPILSSIMIFRTFRKGNLIVKYRIRAII